MNLADRLEQTWQQSGSVTIGELMVLIMVQNEKIRILSRTQSLTTKDELKALDMAMGQFLISKGGGE